MHFLELFRSLFYPCIHEKIQWTFDNFPDLKSKIQNSSSSGANCVADWMNPLCRGPSNERKRLEYLKIFLQPKNHSGACSLNTGNQQPTAAFYAQAQERRDMLNVILEHEKEWWVVNQNMLKHMLSNESSLSLVPSFLTSFWEVLRAFFGLLPTVAGKKTSICCSVTLTDFQMLESWLLHQEEHLWQRLLSARATTVFWVLHWPTRNTHHCFQGIFSKNSSLGQ